MMCPEEEGDDLYVKLPPRNTYLWDLSYGKIRKGKPREIDLDEWS